jgi:hypothetical protein
MTTPIRCATDPDSANYRGSSASILPLSGGFSRLAALTGVGTAWTAQTSFQVTGGTGASLSQVTVVSSTMAVMVLQPGAGPATLAVSDGTDAAFADFTVTGGVVSGLTATYNPATPIGQVRLKTGDVDVSQTFLPRSSWSCFYSDAELQVFLNDYGGDVNFAAAMALRSVALRPELLGQHIATAGLDISVGDLMKRYNDAADALIRGRAMVPAEMIVETNVNDFTARRIIVNEWLRTVPN